MTKTKTINRQQAAASALASVRAEGLEPSPSTLRRIQLYVTGDLTAQQLRQETLAEVRARSR